MSPDRLIFRGGRGIFGLLVALLLWLPAGETRGEATGFYLVGVEVTVPLPVAANQDPHLIGMEMAKKAALDRLLHRLFASADLEKNKPFFDSLAQGMRYLTERVVVVGESQRANALLVSVDVTFSAKGITAALAQKGLSYNETRPPPVLFLVRTQGGPPEETATADALLSKNLLEEAKALSLPVVTPLGDMEDMGHLTWDLAANGDPALQQWASTRYGADRVWAVAVQLLPASGAGGTKTTGYLIRAQLLGGGTLGPPGQTPPEWLQAEVSTPTPPSRCTDSGETGIHHCPYAILARTLLQKLADQWILTHTLNPALLHTTTLRVIHGPKLAQLAQFVARLRAAPGVTNLKFVEERATESRLQVEYQGQDAQLQGLLGQLGAQIEGENSLPSSPETAPSDQMEMVLRLP